MNSNKMRIIQELLAHLEGMDAEDLGAAAKPPEAAPMGVEVEVAELDPEKTKGFEMGFKKKLGIEEQPSGPVKGPMDKLAEAAGHMGDEGDGSEMDDEELMEREKFLV